MKYLTLLLSLALCYSTSDSKTTPKDTSLVSQPPPTWADVLRYVRGFIGEVKTITQSTGADFDKYWRDVDRYLDHVSTGRAGVVRRRELSPSSGASTESEECASWWKKFKELVHETIHLMKKVVKFILGLDDYRFMMRAVSRKSHFVAIQMPKFDLSIAATSY